MPNIAPLQDDFSAGEISPRLRAKTRSGVYQSGLAFCENFEVTPQGSLQMRGGTEFINLINDINIVLHTFSRALNTDVIVAIGENNIFLFDRSGPIQGSSFGNFIRDPQFKEGLNEWTTTSSSQGNYTITPNFGSGVTISANRTGTPVAWGGLNQDFYVPVTGVPYRFRVVMTILPSDGSPIFDRYGRLRMDCRPLNGSGFVFYDETFSASNPPPAVGDQIVLEGFMTPAEPLMRVNFSVSGAVSGSSLKVKFSAFELDDLAAIPEPVSFPTPASWQGSLPVTGLPKTGDIHSCSDSAERKMYFTVTDGEPHQLTYDPNTNVWAFGVFDPVNNPWVDDYPSTCTFHQGRLWLAGSPLRPSTIWASRTFDYDDFELVVVDPVDDDPLEFTLSSNGAIQWLDGLKFLLVGTDRGEVIGRSSGPVITGSDFEFPVEQTWGSYRVQPRQIGNQLIYTTTDRKRIRSLFDGGDTTNGYDSEDLTITAENIINDRVLDISFVKNPDYKLNCVLSNGQTVVATKYPQNDQTAWYRFKTNGFIVSQTETRESTGTALWSVVSRINSLGIPVFYLEVRNAGVDAKYNLDSFVSTDWEATDNRIITGLSHLENYECSIVILLNDQYALHDPKTPVNGAIQLDDWVPSSGQALVGIPFTATAKLLPMEGSNPQGTAQIQKRRYNEVFLRLFDSGIPMINGVRPAIRNTSSPMSASEPLFTGDTSTHQVSWDDGEIEITQDLPLPTNIAGVFGKAKGNAV